MARLVRIWLLHPLAFLAGQIVSGVTVFGLLSLGDWVTRAGPGLPWRVLGAAGISLALGYIAYLRVISMIADLSPGRAPGLWGPLPLLAVTGLTVAVVCHGLAAATVAGLSGYARLLLAGGLRLSLASEEEA